MPRVGTAKKHVYELLTGMQQGERFRSRDLCDEVSEKCGYDVSPHTIGYILGLFEQENILEREEVLNASNYWVLVRPAI